MRDKILVLTFTCLLQLHSSVEGLNPERYSNNYDVFDDNSGRILNGVPANLFDFTFVVAVPAWRGGDCTGSIIGSEWVITAGHCVANFTKCYGIRIHPAAWPPSEFVHALKCVFHPKFDGGKISGVDLSLIKIQPSFQMDDQTRIIPLMPAGSMTPKYTPAIIAGYGQTETGIIPHRLLRADVQIEDWTVCKRKVRLSQCGSLPICNYPELTDAVFCTQGQGPAAGGVCYGDSGGPVLVNGYLAGVSQYILPGSHGRCAVGSPSYHVNIISYLDWIYSHIGRQ